MCRGHKVCMCALWVAGSLIQLKMIDAGVVVTQKLTVYSCDWIPQIINNTRLYCEPSSKCDANRLPYRSVPYPNSHAWISTATHTHTHTHTKKHFKFIFLGMGRTLTLFPRQCLWREMHHRKDWPSSGFPNGPFCSLYRPIVGRDGGWRAYEQYGDLLACLEKQTK